VWFNLFSKKIIDKVEQAKKEEAWSKKAKNEVIKLEVNPTSEFKLEFNWYAENKEKEEEKESEYGSSGSSTESKVILEKEKA
jgi:hypothetical protein